MRNQLLSSCCADETVLGEAFLEAIAGQDDIPPLGLVGDRSLIESFEGDLHDFAQRINRALKEKLKVKDDAAFWTRAFFKDFIVVERDDGKLWRYSYSVGADDAVTFGDGEEVKEAFLPVTEGAVREATTENPFLEATDKVAAKWRIRIIRAGASGNRNFYTDRSLREAAPMFNGARVFVKSDEEHLKGRGKDVRNLIGALSDIAFVEGAGADTGELHATLSLIEPEGSVGKLIASAHDGGMTNLFGFSINARAITSQRMVNGQAFREAKKFTKVTSVDLIVEPGAAGGIIDLIEAKKEENVIMDRAQLLALLKGMKLYEAKHDTMDDDALAQAFTEAVQSVQSGSPAPGTTEVSLQEAVAEAVTNATRMVEARATARDLIGKSSLPPKAKDRLVNRFNAETDFKEADVREAIRSESEYLGAAGGGQVTGLGAQHRVSLVESRFEKTQDMLEAFFDRGHADHRHAQSFRECYIAVTGDQRVTGQLRHVDEGLMREALGSDSFSNVLGNTLRRRMVADYNNQTIFDAWRQVVDVVNVSDFRTQERTRYGGYGDLPKVAEKDPYVALASPDDEKATYAVEKRGGTETLTLEMIKNDDVGAVRRIPTKLSRSAKRTVSRFVFGFISANPVIYDEVAFFHGDHGNLGSAALGAASFAAGRLAMMQQTERDSGEKLSIGPKFLLVPDTLEETAVNLFRRNTENDKTFVQSLTPQIIPVWCFEDGTDWALMADPADIPTIEIGFLDGQEEPELFVQDNATVGSMFTHDQITWKIRHIYGGNVTDYRGGYKAVVAGG